MSPIGAALIVVFLALAGLHLYWGFGGMWPGQDAATLRLRVVGTHSGPMFGFVACAMVAGALSAAAAIVFARHHVLSSDGLRAWLVYGGYAALILVFALRGLAPYLSPVFDYARGTPFFDLNRLYYAPLCLLVAAGLIVSFPPGLGRLFHRPLTP